MTINGSLSCMNLKTHEVNEFLLIGMLFEMTERERKEERKKGWREVSK